MSTAQERFARAITALAETYRQSISDGLLHGYRLGLQGLTIGQIEKAAQLALQRNRYMPTPAELREMATAGEGYELLADKAWLALREAIRRLGSDASVNFDDGLINATVRLMGGWIRVCDLEPEELDKWARKDFVATYVRLLRDGASEELRRYHGGRLERDNAHWQDRPLPGNAGAVFRLGMFGTGVNRIGVDYQPALPPADVQPRLPGAAAALGLELKTLPPGHDPPPAV